jgi:hypothetical protein
LPRDIREAADRAFDRQNLDPFHPSLQFKEVRPGGWSARVGLHYRALGERIAGDLVLWDWIGPHSEYDGLLGGGE